MDGSRITERLIVGGHIGGLDGIAWLADQGVTDIISAAAELSDRQWCVQRNLGYYHLRWHDDKQPKPIGDFLKVLAWVRSQEGTRIAHRKRTALYIHCAMGVNRGPLLATFLLAALSGLSADEAWAAIKTNRPHVESFDVPAYRQSCLLALEGCQVNTVPESAVAPMLRAITVPVGATPAQ